MVQYKVAEGPDDYMECQALMRHEGLEAQDLVFPTIMAYEDDELAGFMATTPDPERVLAGPLVLRQDGKRRPFTAMNLMTLYDTALNRLGIKAYTFFIDETQSGLVRGIKKYFPELQPYAKRGDNLFFVRHIGAEA